MFLYILILIRFLPLLKSGLLHNIIIFYHHQQHRFSLLLVLFEVLEVVNSTIIAITIVFANGFFSSSLFRASFQWRKSCTTIIYFVVFVVVFTHLFTTFFYVRIFFSLTYKLIKKNKNRSCLSISLYFHQSLIDYIADFLKNFQTLILYCFVVVSFNIRIVYWLFEQS